MYNPKQYNKVLSFFGSNMNKKFAYKIYWPLKVAFFQKVLIPFFISKYEKIQKTILSLKFESVVD